MEKIKKRIEKKKKTAADYVLLSIFILLLIFVIYLLFRLKDAKKEYELTKDADFTMPIIETRLSAFKVNVSNKKKDDIITYKLNITNYRSDEVNKKEVQYKIYVKPEVKAEYTLKNREGKNVLDEKNITEYIKLPGKKKTVDSYTLKIKLKEDVKEHKEVIIFIEGKK